MADRGIIFSAPMVRALLDGRKTQTRRLLKLTPPEDADQVHTWFAPQHVPVEGIANEWAQSGLWAVQHIRGGEDGEPASGGYNRYCGALPYRPGDRLYVREAFSGPKTYEDIKPSKWPQDMPCIRYWADDHRTNPPHPVDEGKGKPSIHLPRWASRLTLTVTDVRVQRVQEISEADAIAEGPPCHVCGGRFPSEDDCHCFHRKPGRIDFEALWNSLHTKPGETWDANPFVVAVSFDVRRGNIDRSEG